MNFRFLALAGLAVTAMTGFSPEASAMNLLVAVGNPQIQITLTAEGDVQVVAQEPVEVSQLEPASGTDSVQKDH